MHRVAITGVGIVSCLGNTVETVGNALRNGQSGIVFDEERHKLGFRSPLTGVIRGFDPRAILSKKQGKTMPDFAIQAYAAASDAIRMAALAPEQIENEETGLIFGCDSSCIAAVEQVDLLRERGETKLIGSGQVFRSMTSCITMNLNTLLKTRGACWTISSACSSGGHAVGQAADLIAMGRQERVICGGAQEINWQSMCSFDALGAFSVRLDAPGHASRPFDARRDGLVPSGGAAALVLERYDLAVARGAVILGEVTGYAFSSDGNHISIPSQEGLQRAMRKAIGCSGIEPADIGYICAHATSTPAGDAAEAGNISAVFGPKTPWVSSLKSMTGHELWMSGASQVVYSVIMVRQGFIAPNANFSEPDEYSARLNIAAETHQVHPGTCPLQFRRLWRDQLLPGPEIRRVIYDFVVIGAGIAGITSALTLARNGYRVALVEKREQTAPLLRGFSRRGIHFDTGFHYTGGLGAGEPLDVFFRYLGVADHLVTFPFREQGFDLFRSGRDAFEFQLPYGYELLREKLAAAFPEDAAAIDQYLGMVRKTCASLPYLNLAADFNAFTALHEVQGPTLAETLDSLTGNRLLKSLLGMHCLLYGVPPEQIPFSQHARIVGNYYQSTHGIQGGGLALAHAFDARLSSLASTSSSATPSPV